MPTKELRCEDVIRIRGRLGFTREQLADALDVTADAIKKWEDGSRVCRGPARLLLLLERVPKLVSMLDEAPVGLPPAVALVPQSPDWFRAQRLYAIIGGGHGVADWNDIVDEEGLTPEWLQEAKRGELLGRHDRNPELRRATERAYRRFRLDAWTAWVRERRFETTAQIPVMTLELLAEFSERSQ